MEFGKIDWLPKNICFEPIKYKWLLEFIMKKIFKKFLVEIH